MELRENGQGHFILILIVTAFFIGCGSLSNSERKGDASLPMSGFVKAADRVSAAIGTPGLKGIHLGLSRNAIRDITGKTPWVIKSGRIDRSTTLRLGVDPNPTGIEWSKIACETGKGSDVCAFVDRLVIRFEKDLVVEFSVESPRVIEDISLPDWSFQDIEMQVIRWGEISAKVIIEQFGQPAYTYRRFREIDIFSFEDGVSLPICEWDLGRSRIEIELCRKRTTYWCRILFSEK